MEKIRVLFIQEKKIKNKAKQLLLGDVIESQDPGTYEFDYIGIKENITAKLGSSRVMVGKKYPQPQCLC